MPDAIGQPAVYRSTRCLRHCPAEGHPESPDRLSSVYAMLDSREMAGVFVEQPGRRAGIEDILRVHSAAYHRFVAGTCGQVFTALTADTHASEHSYDAACHAAGGVLAAVDYVSENQGVPAFVLTRPPGHHAEATRALGYCLFNNVAIGARYAGKVHAFSRVLIVDWDVHHGNGTQHIFERDPSVLFFSTHQRALFPGTGSFTETGLGAGEGFTVNLPLPPGMGDAEMAAVYAGVLQPIAVAFAPDIMMVSAGFDTHENDPLGGMRMTAGGFAALTRIVMDLAERLCNGRLVFVLEGGYHGPALAESVRAVIRELAGRTRTRIADLIAAADTRRVHYALKRCMRVHQMYWKCLGKKPLRP